MKYRIIINYDSKNYSLHENEFDSIDEAVKFAISHTFGNDFYIIQIIDWKAQ